MKRRRLRQQREEYRLQNARITEQEKELEKIKSYYNMLLTEEKLLDPKGWEDSFNTSLNRLGENAIIMDYHGIWSKDGKVKPEYKGSDLVNRRDAAISAVPEVYERFGKLYDTEKVSVNALGDDWIEVNLFAKSFDELDTS